MTLPVTHINGGHYLVNFLSAQGVSRVACVAGESYLAVLDALVDFPDIEVVTCRHESGAAFMAEAWGKLSGKPGVVMVTRGPGICNASIGVHTAMQDSTPLLVLMGQVPRHHKGKEAFQEISVESVFGSMCKWAAEIDTVQNIPEYMSKAYYTAMEGRPGPVVLGLPEDVLSESVDENAVSENTFSQNVITRDVSKIADQDFENFLQLLKQARKPLCIVGGAGWDDKTCQLFECFASDNSLPVAASFRRHDLFNHESPSYIGELGTGPNPQLLQRFSESDLIIALGARLNDITTQGYSLIQDHHKLVHIHPSEKDLQKNYTPALALSCDVSSFVERLSSIYPKEGQQLKSEWQEWCESARQAYVLWSGITPQNIAVPWQGANMHDIFFQLKNALPQDSIVTSDAGNFSGWAQRYLHYARPGRMLGPVCGAMGYGLPAAVASSLLYPEKTVIGLCGDGGFLMTVNEIATAIHHNATPIIFVFNNSMYGTIRMHQEMSFPGRPCATDLTNPDFVKVAQSFGAYGASITHAEQFQDVWDQALNAHKVSVIEIQMDPRQLTTASKITD